MEALEKMFRKITNQNNTTVGSLAAKIDYTCMFNANFTHNDVRIVDSRASDHMTGKKYLLEDYSSYKGNLTVNIADGSFSKVEGVDSAYLTDKLVLQTMLYVPNFTCNLFSVSKLVKDLNCIAKFTSDLCEFQILDLEKMISCARMSSGPYQLKSNGSPTRQTHKAASLLVQGHVFDSNKENEIMLCHYRLGHPNFLYLQKLFPSLFINKNPKLFQCEVC